MVGERVGDRRLRNVASFVIAASLMAVTGTAAVAVWPGLRQAVGLEASEAGYRPGDLVQVPAGDARRAVVVFGRRSCSACERARPFLGRLARAVADTPGTRMFFVSTDPTGADADEREFLRDLGLPDDAGIRMDTRQLKIRIVPTVVLLDEHGVVLHAWAGFPGDDQQRAILAEVSRPGARE